MRRLFSKISILIFAWFYINVTMFPHTHSVDGTMVIHSHIYNIFNKQSPHNHTKSELSIIKFWDSTSIDNSLIFLTNLGSFQLKTDFYTNSYKSFFSNSTFKLAQLRAPPIC